MEVFIVGHKPSGLFVTERFNLIDEICHAKIHPEYRVAKETLRFCAESFNTLTSEFEVKVYSLEELVPLELDTGYGSKDTNGY